MERGEGGGLTDVAAIASLLLRTRTGSSPSAKFEWNFKLNSLWKLRSARLGKEVEQFCQRIASTLAIQLLKIGNDNGFVKPCLLNMSELHSYFAIEIASIAIGRYRGQSTKT